MSALASAPSSSRLAAIDWLRGLVMVLMTIDHASMHYNAGRVSADSATSYVVGSALPAAQFFTRWMTHLCAPTFVFLAGTSLALSVAAKQRANVPEREITRDLLIRGAVIVLCDLLYMSLLAKHVLLQVLYAIGASMLLMAAVRRLPTRALLGMAVLGIVASEAVLGAVWDPHGEPASVLLSVLLAPHYGKTLLVVYPVLPWFWMMLLGWCFGQWLLRQQSAPSALSASRFLWVAGVASLLMFVAVRGADGYGNMFLHREDNSLSQWLHVSKYPPGISYTTLELGLMALLLSGLMALEARVTARGDAVGRNNPLLVFGQTALFFYLLHQFLLGASAMGLGLSGKGGLLEAYVAAALALVVLYPLCRWYRSYKQAHPRSFVRFV